MTPAPSNLLTRLEHAALTDGAIMFLCSAAADGDAECVSWAELHDDARAYAAVLQSRGIGPRSHVAILGPTSRALVTAVQATWLCGAATVMLPLPMRLASIDEFVQQTRV